jgi:hypothetical protein
MSRPLDALAAVSAVVAVFAVGSPALGAGDGRLAGPAGAFKGTATGGATGSAFVGSGTVGGGGDGDGGFDGGQGDGGSGGDDPGAGISSTTFGASSGPGGALSGMTVAAVRRLQAELAGLGYFHHVVTGYYGDVTTAAVKGFQRSAGLNVDGIWGRQSAAALTRRLSR